MKCTHCCSPSVCMCVVLMDEASYQCDVILITGVSPACHYIHQRPNPALYIHQRDDPVLPDVYYQGPNPANVGRESLHNRVRKHFGTKAGWKPWPKNMVKLPFYQKTWALRVVRQCWGSGRLKGWQDTEYVDFSWSLTGVEITSLKLNALSRLSSHYKAEESVFLYNYDLSHLSRTTLVYSLLPLALCPGHCLDPCYVDKANFSWIDNTHALTTSIKYYVYHHYLDPCRHWKGLIVKIVNLLLDCGWRHFNRYAFHG